MGFAAAATPMAPALVSALSEPAPAAADPIFSAIERHLKRLRAHDEAGAQYHKLKEFDPDWRGLDTLEERIALADSLRGGPSCLAHTAWGAAADALEEATNRLIETSPTTLGGVIAVLDYWAEFMEVVGNDSEYDFLGLEINPTFLTNVAAAARNLITRGQA